MIHVVFVYAECVFAPLRTQTEAEQPPVCAVAKKRKERKVNGFLSDVEHAKTLNTDENTPNTKRQNDLLFVVLVFWQQNLFIGSRKVDRREVISELCGGVCQVFDVLCFC